MADAQATQDVLRQLAIAANAYRLTPGDLSQPGFTAAVDRVRRAVEAAVATGPVAVDLKRGDFRTEDGTVLSDEIIDRFAADCYSRGVEGLVVTSVPDAKDLAALGDALLLKADEIAERGGPQTVLLASGVSSIRLREVRPEAVETPAGADLPPEQQEMLDEIADPERAAANLMVGGMPREAVAAARQVYRRFKTMFGTLPDHILRQGDVLPGIHSIVSHLPQHVAREFFAQVVTMLQTDEFAEAYLRNLADADLASDLVRLGKDGGPDPVELAERISAATERPGGIVELVRILSGDVEDEVADGGTFVTMTDPEDRTLVRQDIPKVLARSLLAFRQEDVQTLAELFPTDDGERKLLSHLALRDYLRAEDDLERLDRVLHTWVAEVRGQVRAGNVAEIERLLALLADPLEHSVDDRPKHRRLSETREHILDDELLAELLERVRGEADTELLEQILDRVGPGAVDTLLGALADEDARGARAQLVGLVADVGADAIDRITPWLDDSRWFVVRNVVTILGRIGSPETYVALTKLIHHPNPVVRRELARALVATGGEPAISYVRRLADDADEGVRTAAVNALVGIRSDRAAQALADVVRRGTVAQERERALKLLADHPAPTVPELLDDLASRGGSPKLPRQLRKTAKAAAKQRRGDA